MCYSNPISTQLSFLPLAWLVMGSTMLVTNLRLARWPVTHSPFRTPLLRMHVESLKLRPHVSPPSSAPTRTLYLVKRS